MSVSGIQHMEETNSSHQRQPGALLAQGRLQPLEFSPGEEAALPVQEPGADRIQQLPAQGKQGMSACARECSALAAWNGQDTAAGRNRNISLQGGHPHFLGQLGALGNPTGFH